VIRRVDRYELLEQVGTGGMAVVYRGRDTALDREVAVKLLHPHLAARAESRARFSREARAVARLNHPNIVEIFDYAGDAAVESYLVTEFVHGRTLRAFADEEHIRYPEVGALLARALADALAHAHAAGVIHRDLKPENVLVLETGGRRALKLVDFGIARILASEERMTLTGALVGSPNHMAPEIIEGGDADERSDVFSLGTILYWLCTGAMPFAASNPTATLRRVLEGDHRDPRQANPLVSDDLAGVIARALLTDPAARTPSAEALRGELDAALAAAGLDDPAAELDAFLAGPGEYEAALRGRLVAAALSHGEHALEEGETALGMKLLDRVLALEPGNTAVAARLERIASVARWKRRARLGGAVLGALAVALVAWLAVQRSAPRESSPDQAGRAAHAPIPATQEPARASTPTPSAPSTPQPARPAPAPAVAAPVEPPAAETSADATPVTGAPAAPATHAAAGSQRANRAPPRPEPAAQRPAPGGTAIVSLHVRPYAQRALLDGVEIARGEQRVTFRLASGLPHRIQVEHACCFPFVREFKADDAIPQPLELKVPLRARPARLRVEADPASRVYVDGKLVGTAGESQRAPLEVPVPSTGETPYEASAELALDLDGRPPVRTSLRLRAGAEVTFAATHPPPPPAEPERAEPEPAGAAPAPDDGAPVAGEPR
jgi:serine/threonine-protein kinase